MRGASARNRLCSQNRKLFASSATLMQRGRGQPERAARSARSSSGMPRGEAAGELSAEVAGEDSDDEPRAVRRPRALASGARGAEVMPTKAGMSRCSESSSMPPCPRAAPPFSTPAMAALPAAAGSIMVCLPTSTSNRTHQLLAPCAAEWRGQRRSRGRFEVVEVEPPQLAPAAGAARRQRRRRPSGRGTCCDGASGVDRAWRRGWLGDAAERPHDQ